MLRISHWSKAIFVLLGVIYFDQPGYWLKALIAALSFCLIASAVYIYNDLKDIDEDKFHPQKSQRPLANGKVSIEFAWYTLIFLLLSGFAIAFALSNKLSVILGIYLLINFFYNYWLRKIPIFDVLCVASGFFLRILAGTIGIGLPLTWWLTITATLFSLFIALNKRRLEMRLQVDTNRAVLKKYNPRVLDLLIGFTALSCFLTYLIYIVSVHHELFYFLLTLPFAALGLGRFIWLTNKSIEHDDPVSLFFNDPLSRLNLVCFFTLTLLALV